MLAVIYFLSNFNAQFETVLYSYMYMYMYMYTHALRVAAVSVRCL